MGMTEGPLKVELASKTNSKIDVGQDTAVGISALAGLTFTGEGSLTVNAGTGILAINAININGGSFTVNAGMGIYAFSDIAINGGTISATGTNIGIDTDNGSVIIGENASVTATGAEMAMRGSVKNAIAGTG